MAKRILIVDDYVDGLEMWELCLRLHGYDVQTTTDGKQALRMAAADHPDLIVLDLELPGASGTEVARQLRADVDTESIPLIASTGTARSSDIESAKRSGFDAILIKPYEPTRLVEEIDRLLALRT